MNVIFMGYMGSGKSTLARLFAESIGLSAIDLDDYISEKEKMSIPEIFEKKGEIYFRRIEGTYLNELLTSDEALILALGGGTPCYGNNMELIKEKATSVYLRGSIPTLSKRLTTERSKRPLIASLEPEQLTEYIAKHLFERRAYYEQADHIIAIDNKTPHEIMKEIKAIELL